jgi:hypothetical protein
MAGENIVDALAEREKAEKAATDELSQLKRQADILEQNSVSRSSRRIYWRRSKPSRTPHTEKAGRAA